MHKINSALVTWVEENYNFSNPKIELVRSYTNDVYKVINGSSSYILKIYGLGWRTISDIEWEIELLEFLFENGLEVARAIAGASGDYVKSFEERLAALYDFAPGQKPNEPFTTELYFLFGQSIGKMHKISSSFKPKHKRKNIDISYLIDTPLELTSQFLFNNDQRLKSLVEIAVQVKSKLNSFKNLDWGPIHGDATLDNLHVTSDNKVILYDFDSGGMGWRASDLQGWAVNKPEYKEKYISFTDGYKTENVLNEVDLQASSYITIAWEIWGLEVELKNRVIRKGQDSINIYLEKQINIIRDLFEGLVNS